MWQHRHVDPYASSTVRAAYDRAADDYAEAFGDEVARLPLDSAMVQAAIDAQRPAGIVLEVGSGPAPAATFIGTGTDASMRGLVAIDLSSRMVALAAARNPGMAPVQADIRRLPVHDGACSLIIASYVIQHLPRHDLPATFTELHRALAPGGLLLLVTHLGDGEVTIDELLGHRFDPVGGTFHGRDEIDALLDGAHFRIEVRHERGPMPGEFDTQRLYVLARSI